MGMKFAEGLRTNILERSYELPTKTGNEGFPERNDEKAWFPAIPGIT